MSTIKCRACDKETIGIDMYNYVYETSKYFCPHCNTITEFIDDYSCTTVIYQGTEFKNEYANSHFDYYFKHKNTRISKEEFEFVLACIKKEVLTKENESRSKEEIINIKYLDKFIWKKED